MKENNVDVWDAFLGTLENRGLSSVEWEISPDVQEKLVDYFKAKIDAGVIDGETRLPLDLIWNEYVWRLPEAMCQQLQEHAENALETDSDNGAAAKFLAIALAGWSYDIPPDEYWTFSEKATLLLPNDLSLCYLAFVKSGIDPLYFDKAVIALEGLLEWHREGEASTLYQWLFRCCYDYLYVTTRPNDFYKELESDNPLYERWTAVMGKIQVVFEEQLVRHPGDWEIVRMLTEIQEALGNTAAAEKVFKKSQKVYEKQLEQDADDRSALRGLANIHEKLGNIELASEYQVKADPSLGWVGQVLPDFSAAVDLDGTPISLADYRGKVVLLDFWAVWCGPCLGEIPRIKAVYEKYHDKGFDVIGVSLDEDAAVLREFIKEKEIPWRQIFDGQKWAGHLVQQYGVRGIPAPFLIDREGKVISVEARGSLLDELVAAEITGKAD
ncbi:TlpA family protein disulfide reductase [Candidatus Poribacteria bacterium]|nr:TlpA family protein disulfide reductase [Candidatus Poribacteria bacterium]MYK24315.1 TlpA family protein disulfide reductase [Candidatus Poribacteria bacterium]